MSRRTMILAAGLLLAACGADEAASTAEDSSSADVLAAAEVSPDVAAPDLVAGPELPAPVAFEQVELPVGAGACCMTVSPERVVWAEGGDLWLYDPTTGDKGPIVVGPGTQTEPVLADGQLIWADDRGGDFDLWVLDFSTAKQRALVTGAGDQRSPAFGGGRLAWVGTGGPPYGTTEREIWTMDIAGGGSPVRLTEDDAEQNWPHTDGKTVVWTDFRNDPDKRYVDAKGTDNNGDIYGWDVARGVELVVETGPDKQARPAVEGEFVVWMDWAGVTPEPKFASFVLRSKSLVDGTSVDLAESNWPAPELNWRPSLDAGWLYYLRDGSAAAVPAGGGDSKSVVEAADLVSVAARAGVVGWVRVGSVGAAAAADLLAKP